MKDCIFCKIVNNDIPSYKIWEDSNYYAFLDINPNTDGVTLVIPKEHHTSDPVKVNEATLKETLEAAIKVSKKIIDAFDDVDRVGYAIEGTGVDHLHIKLYPFHTDKNHKATESSETVFNDYYQGYMTTKLGPKVDLDKLEKLADKIRSS